MMAFSLAAKKAAKLSEQENRPSLYTEDELEKAIKRKFAAEPGKISIRHLWSIDSMHRYRVNWWGNKDGEDCIISSRYLKIVADEEGIEITEAK